MFVKGKSIKWFFDNIVWVLELVGISPRKERLAPFCSKWKIGIRKLELSAKDVYVCWKPAMNEIVEREPNVYERETDVINLKINKWYYNACEGQTFCDFLAVLFEYLSWLAFWPPPLSPCVDRFRRSRQLFFLTSRLIWRQTTSFGTDMLKWLLRQNEWFWWIVFYDKLMGELLTTICASKVHFGFTNLRSWIFESIGPFEQYLGGLPECGSQSLGLSIRDNWNCSKCPFGQTILKNGSGIKIISGSIQNFN